MRLNDTFPFSRLYREYRLFYKRHEDSYLLAVLEGYGRSKDSLVKIGQPSYRLVLRPLAPVERELVNQRLHRTKVAISVIIGNVN